jgi:hypothetical protein
MAIFISAAVRVPNIAQYGVEWQPYFITYVKETLEEMEV